MMRLDFWTWPLRVVDVGPNILLLLRAKLTCSDGVQSVGNDTTQKHCLSFSVRGFLRVQNPQHPPPRYPKSRDRHCVQAACGGTTGVTTACARAVREYIRHASLAGDVLAVGSVSQLS